MAISPFKFGANKNGAKKTSSVTQSSLLSSNDRLSLSQALTITAGLAGLVGLCSGIVIRFSLANSDNARFLSPLQTFPTISSWTPESSSASPNDTSLNETDARRMSLQEAEDFENWDSLRESARVEDEPLLFQTEERSDTDSWATEDSWSEDSAFERGGGSNASEEPLDTDIEDTDIDPSTFDSFANRTDEDISSDIRDPWKRLEEGPQFDRSTQFDRPVDGGDRLNKDSADDLDGGRAQSYYENAYDEPEDESWYGGSYEDDSYNESPYGGTSYDDSSYDNSAYDNDSYNDGSYRDDPYDYE